MSTEEYVRHPWFQLHGAAIKEHPNQRAFWLAEPELRNWLQQQDWQNIFLISHHAQWDHFALSWHYNVMPKMSGCTLSMARLLLGNHLSVSLDAVRRHYGMPLKSTPYNLFRGKHWHEMTAQVQQQVAAGAVDEVESVWEIFGLLYKDFPKEELEVIDTTVKMFTQPCLRGDIEMFAKVWEEEERKKQQRITDLQIDPRELSSNERFADLLRACGVEPETKDGKNGPIYAFAKTDDFMRDLQEHDDDRVRALAEARLGVKSTLMQTRAATLGWMARRGPMPVYLRYAGAHTTRWSGGDGANWQNFRRDDPDNPRHTLSLRKAIIAPEGHLLAPIDLSQIECRILNYLAGQEDVVEKFRTGEDPYIGIASMAYGFPVTKANKTERGTGKQLELSCGYMAGAETIQNTAKLGIYGPPVYIDLATALRWRDLYRSTHPFVTDYWKIAGRMIARIGGGEPLDWGPMLIKDKKIYGPGGTMLIYDTLEYYRPEPDEEVKEFERDGYWRYRTRNGWTKLYSGKLVENVIQWLARIVMSQAMVRIVRLGYHVANTTHDELLVVIPKDGREEHHLAVCMSEMKRTPDWLPGIPLDAEGSLGERYSK